MKFAINNLCMRLGGKKASCQERTVSRGYLSGDTHTELANLQIIDSRQQQCVTIPRQKDLDRRRAGFRDSNMKHQSIHLNLSGDCPRGDKVWTSAVAHNACASMGFLYTDKKPFAMSCSVAGRVIPSTRRCQRPTSVQARRMACA